MITLLQSQGQVFTDADKLIFSLVWGVLSIISANILLHIWKYEGKLTLLSYLGAVVFGTFLAPIVSTIFFLGWLGTITPYQARNWIRESVRNIKEASTRHWKLKSKQAPPHFSVGSSSGIAVHPNPPAIHNGPYINDMMNVRTPSSHSFVGHPVPSMGRGVGPNRMTRLSNGSGVPSWYVPAPPPAVRAKKAAPKM
jgi:hypothetical protein